MVSRESDHRSSWFSPFEKVFVDNDPELVEILSQLSLELSSYSNLDEKIRVKVALAALIAIHATEPFKRMLESAWELEVSSVEIREIVYQAIPYVGLGKAFDFIAISNDFFSRHNIVLPIEPQAQTALDTRYEIGLETVRLVAGDKVETMLETMPDNQKHFAALLINNCFGDYFSRTGLSANERELLIFSYLAAMGGAESQLKGHISNNVRIGNSKERLVEVLTVLLPFIGYPRTLTALTCINQSVP